MILSHPRGCWARIVPSCRPSLMQHADNRLGPHLKGFCGGVIEATVKGACLAVLVDHSRPHMHEHSILVEFGPCTQHLMVQTCAPLCAELSRGQVCRKEQVSGMQACANPQVDLWVDSRQEARFELFNCASSAGTVKLYGDKFQDKSGKILVTNGELN